MDRHGRGGLGPELEFSVIGELTRSTIEVIEALDRLIPQARPTKHPVVARVAFTDIVSYFRDEHPNDFRIAAGALLRRPSARGIALYQVFLDDKDRIVIDERGMPYGRALRAREIDDELNVRFGRTDLIIFR